ncbi:synaptic vesicle transporter [Talaromyces proteolyticus]|uniref:Synaptic vesicle transporter n=1 Tax=Talaromyces proteolyticus TaxID=1131652 RepID=A0AAD4KYJ5_9EURO|nr:synaptic vesicle transporter [Talaromyces proteolyticus]KAH8702168.1 synaptic vesicle transporter [Talaromyces proteolyticus]
MSQPTPVINVTEGENVHEIPPPAGIPCQQSDQDKTDQEIAASSQSNFEGDRMERDPEKSSESDYSTSNIVTWDGPDDPSNPKNWSFKRRWLATGLVSLITFMTPIASSMIAPAEFAINRDLDVHSTFDSELIFSIFLLAFVVGPLFLAPLSEVYGRVIVLQLANVWFLIFNLVCGFAQNVSQMLAFRFLAGLGACAPQTVGGGVLSDLWTSEERGKAVALYTLAPVLGPSVGPLMGAWIAERTTWRWSFWSVTMFGVAVQVLIYFTLAETFAPRILQRKAQKLRKETGNEQLRTEFESNDDTILSVMRRVLTRVFLFLGTQPIVQFLALYMALIYGVIYLILSTYPTVWTNVYHESTGIGGLNYLSLMIGLTIGAQVAGRLIDTVYNKLKQRAPNGEGRPEFRVPILFGSTILTAGGIFMYGWSAEAHTHWIVPNIGAAIFGAGANMTFTTLQTYTIDTYQLYAASAIGATAVARSATGFAFPLFANYMYDALGDGWGNSVLGFATLGIGYSGSIVLWFFGERLRGASQYAINK